MGVAAQAFGACHQAALALMAERDLASGGGRSRDEECSESKRHSESGPARETSIEANHCWFPHLQTHPGCDK
jgi:hypothetical protein